MLTHIVFFRFPARAIAEQARDLILSMKGQIPELKHLEAGLDIERKDRSWDLALLTRFDDQAGLDAYAVHPVHLQVLAFLRANATSVAAVDYIS